MTADAPMNGESTPQTSRIPLYEGSTQFRHWRFSPEQLAETRSSLNAAAVAVIRDAFESDQVSYFLSMIQRTLLNSWNPVRLVIASFIPECRRREPAREALPRKNPTVMWNLQIPGRGRSHGNVVSQAVLP